MECDKIVLKVKKRFCENCGNGFRIERAGPTSIRIVFACDKCGATSKKVIQLRVVKNKARGGRG